MARAALRVRVPEKAEQAHVVQLLRSIGGQVYVMGGHRRRGDFQGTMQTEGIPDLMAFLPAKVVSVAGGSVCAQSVPPMFVFIECKATGGRLRPEQEAFRLHCQTVRIEHVVGGLDAVIAWLAGKGHVKAESFPHYRQPRSEA